MIHTFQYVSFAIENVSNRLSSQSITPILFFKHWQIHPHAAQPEVTISSIHQPPALATSHLVRWEHLSWPAPAFLDWLSDWAHTRQWCSIQLLHTPTLTHYPRCSSPKALLQVGSQTSRYEWGQSLWAPVSRYPVCLAVLDTVRAGHFCSFVKGNESVIDPLYSININLQLREIGLDCSINSFNSLQVTCRHLTHLWLTWLSAIVDPSHQSWCPSHLRTGTALWSGHTWWTWPVPLRPKETHIMVTTHIKPSACVRYLFMRRLRDDLRDCRKLL